MKNQTINLIGWILFIVSAIGFVISSIGSFWAMFGSLFIPSKQFIARFKFRPWKEVYISEKCLYELENFFYFTKDLVSFYKKNNITPVIESDFSSSEKLGSVYSFLENER